MADLRIRLVVPDVWRIIFAMVINDAYGNSQPLIDKLAPLSPYLANLFMQPWYYELMYYRYREWYRQIFSRRTEWSDTYVDVTRSTLGTPKDFDEYYELATTIMQQSLPLTLLLNENMKDKYRKEFYRDDGKWLGPNQLFDIQIAVGLNFEVCVDNLLTILDNFHQQYIAAPGAYGMGFRLKVCFDLLLGDCTLRMFKPTTNVKLIEKVLAILLHRSVERIFTELSPESILTRILKYGSYTMLRCMRRYYSKDSYLWMIDNNTRKSRLQGMAFEDDSADGLIFESGSFEAAETYVNQYSDSVIILGLINIFRRFRHLPSLKFIGRRMFLLSGRSKEIVEEYLLTDAYTMSYDGFANRILPRTIHFHHPEELPSFAEAFPDLDIRDKYANWHKALTVEELLPSRPNSSPERTIEYLLDVTRVGQPNYRRFLAYVFQHIKKAETNDNLPPFNSVNVRSWLYYVYVYYFYLLGHCPTTPAQLKHHNKVNDKFDLGTSIRTRIVFVTWKMHHSMQFSDQLSTFVLTRLVDGQESSLLRLTSDDGYILPANENFILTGRADCITIFESDMTDIEWLRAHCPYITGVK